MILLLALAVVLLQATSAAPLATIILTAIAGVIAPFLTEGLKRVSSLSGLSALILTVVVSVVLACGAAFWSGEAKSFGDYISLAPWIFSQATILYRLYKPKSTPDTEVESK